MPERRWDLYVRDMLDCCGKVRDYVAGLDRATFFATRILYDAVLWNLTILGEASTRVPESVKAAHQEIPWHAIANTRNRVVHGYPSIREESVWKIIHDDIPELMPQLRVLLAEAEAQGGADPT